MPRVPQPLVLTETEDAPVARIYEAACAPCHGLEGRGDGPVAALLTPRPTDLTRGRFKYRSTPSGTLPPREDVERVIRRGIPGSSMSGWEEFLDDRQIAGLAVLVLGMAGTDGESGGDSPDPVPIPVELAPDLERGREVYDELGCGTCHGEAGRLESAPLESFAGADGHPVRATDLRRPWEFGGGSEAADVYLRVVNGLEGTPMPPYRGTAPESDLWHLSHYVQSLAREPVWSPEADPATVAAATDVSALDPVERGRRLAESIGCALCHSPMREDGSTVEELLYAGGLKLEVGPYGTVVSTNLTSDPETGLGSWSDEEIRKALVEGEGRNGRRLLPFAMPWVSFATLEDEDVDAIIAYLRTLPPMENRVPPPERLPWTEYMWEKFQILVLGREFTVVTFPGNAGSAPIPKSEGGSHG
jgi:mono/diheme cytochrome c family protein